METLVRVQTFTPFPAEAIGLVWEWMNEAPQLNFDDYGPRTLDDFLAEMAKRSETEASWLVLADGEPVGFVGFLPLTARLGNFHGICFTRKSHGKGIGQEALRDILRQLWKAGIEKVSAGFFADNVRVHRFLRSLGAVDEGVLRAQTLRNGKAVDVQIVAIFKEAPCPLVV